MKTIPHKRGQGLGLVYNIAYDGDGYEIWLEGVLLKRERALENGSLSKDPIEREKASLDVAMLDIEQLRGMPETPVAAE